MVWKSKKDGTHYNTDKKVRDVSDNDVIVENNVTVDEDDLEEFAREKKHLFPENKKSVYGILEDIVKDKNAEQINFPDLEILSDNEDEDALEPDISNNDGMIVDMQTANMLLTVINAMNEKNQEKAKKMLETYDGFEKMVSFGWTVVK